jgi:hypothetical protein
MSLAVLQLPRSKLFADGAGRQLCRLIRPCIVPARLPLIVGLWMHTIAVVAGT